MIQTVVKGNKVFQRTVGAAIVTAGIGGGIYYVQADQGTRRAIKVSYIYIPHNLIARRDFFVFFVSHPIIF